jgi:predicted dehydrogenase
LGLKISKKIKAKYITNLREALKSDINAVILSTQPNLFLSYAKKILNSKKHLLVEKPLGLNAVEALKILNIAKKNKRVPQNRF